jgi:hypothetical protein
MEIPAYTQKHNQEFFSRKRGIIMKKKQIRVMEIVPIMLDNHRKQVCEVSIHSLQKLWRYQLTRTNLTNNFLVEKGA